MIHDPRKFFKEGTRLKKLHLESFVDGGWGLLMPGEDAKQRLTITEDGKVWFYRYKTLERYFVEKRIFSISKQSASEILDAVKECFIKNPTSCMGLDAGMWNLTLTSSEDRAIGFYGICSDTDSSLCVISDLIRSKLGLNDLFVFDGNPDYIVGIDINYVRRITERNNVGIDEAKELRETVTIDRGAETIDVSRRLSPECTVNSTYHLGGKVVPFLDKLYGFSNPVGNPPDAVVDSSRTMNYSITVRMKLGEVKIMEGSFDKLGLPREWPEFITGLRKLLEPCGLGNVFNPRIYGTPRRRESELVFCNVKFHEGLSTYCYLAPSDAYEVGDCVIVPVGDDNHEEVAIIDSIEYHTAEDAPYPIDKIKSIIGKHVKGRLYNYVR